MSIEHTLSFQLHRLIKAGDLELFSKQINKLNTFSEMTQAWPRFKIVFTWSDEFTCTEFQHYVLNLRYRPHYSK